MLIIVLITIVRSVLEASVNPMSMSEEIHLLHKVSQPPEPDPKHPLPKRTKVRTTDPRESVEIAMEPEGLGAEKPTTVGKVFKETVSKIPDNAALRYKVGEEWKTITYKEYYNLVIKAGKAFLKVGGAVKWVEPYGGWGCKVGGVSMQSRLVMECTDHLPWTMHFADSAE